MIRKYAAGLIALALLAVAGWMIYVKLHPKTLPAGLIEGVGRIDGDLISLASQYPGTVAQTFAEDGRAVKKGDIVTRLKSDEYTAQLHGIEAQIAARRAELKAHRIDASIAQKTVPLALNKANAQLDTRLAQLKQLAAGIRAQSSVAAQSEKDYRRIAALANKKLVDPHTLEQARLKRDTDRDRLHALEHQKTQAEQAVALARADLAEARASQRKLEAIAAQIAALEHGIDALKAQRARIGAVIDALTLRSPVTGYVVEKIAQNGEVVAPGMATATLIDPATLYLKIYVDTLQNGRISVGNRAAVFLDAFPDRPIPATVVRVAQRAEFTPKEVNVRSDRIQRVFAVHLRPNRPDPRLKLGLSAVGVIAADANVSLPASLAELPPL